jgi:hypothetical protein
MGRIKWGEKDTKTVAQWMKDNPNDSAGDLFNAYFSNKLVLDLKGLNRDKFGNKMSSIKKRGIDTVLSGNFNEEEEEDLIEDEQVTPKYTPKKR